jgi:hypothetical protein
MGSRRTAQNTRKGILNRRKVRKQRKTEPRISRIPRTGNCKRRHANDRKGEQKFKPRNTRNTRNGFEQSQTNEQRNT